MSLFAIFLAIALTIFLYFYEKCIRYLLFTGSGYLKGRLIKLNGKPYLERYYLGKIFNRTFYLHRFLQKDAERNVHNHPWKKGGSFILAGSYVQLKAVDLCPWENESGAILKKEKIRIFNSVNGNSFHRIDKVVPNTWTLFFHSNRLNRKHWGYLNQKKDGDVWVTQFRPHPNFTPSDWWRQARKGKELSRAPYDFA